MILTVASDSNKFVEYFNKSIIQLGYKAQVLGLGQKWTGFIGKLVLLRDYLQPMRTSSEPLCYCDAYDVLFARHLPPIVPGKIVISGESNTLGGNIGAPIQNLWGLCGESHNKWINAGFVYGSIQDIYEMLEWCIEKSKVIKFHNRVVYDKSTNMKAAVKKNWVQIDSNEYDLIPDNRMVHGLDQVLLCVGG